MSEKELLNGMCEAYWKATPGITSSMRNILKFLHANGYRRCAEGQAVTQYCSAWAQADKACRELYERAERAEAEVERLEKDNAEWQDGYSALTAEVERLRADAERYRGLRPVQEPFGYLWPTGRHPEFRFTQQKRDGVDGMPLYTHPPRREPLTDEAIRELWSWASTHEAEKTATTQQHAFARAIERAHGIGGDE